MLSETINTARGPVSYSRLFRKRAAAFYREIDIVRITFRDLGELFFGRGINRREMFVRMRRAKFPVDEKLIARFDFDVIALLRRGSISPAVAEGQAPLVRQKRSAVTSESFRLAQDENTGGAFLFAGHDSVDAFG